MLHSHLPHIYTCGSPLFITWGLHGILPSTPKSSVEGSGKAFVAADRLLDQDRSGLLRRGRLARILINELHRPLNSGTMELHEYVVMPNHVHILITAHAEVETLLNSIKGRSARYINQVLGRRGTFWQRESYDHVVRNQDEFDRISAYIVMNPVRAGLAAEPWEYPYSSAFRQSGAAFRPPLID